MDLPFLYLKYPKSIIQSILQTLGVPYVNGTTSQLFDYLEIVIRNKDISLLKIDDVQDLVVTVL